MHIEEEKLDPKILKQLKYDQRDVNLSIVYKSLMGVGFTAALGTFLGYLFVVGYDHPAPTTSHRVSVIEAAIPAGSPVLQTNSDAPDDIAKVRAHENDVLSTTGPSADAGFYHIPIQSAMKLTLQRGLPVTASAPAMSKPVDSNAKPGPVGEVPTGSLDHLPPPASSKPAHSSAPAPAGAQASPAKPSTAAGAGGKKS